MSACYNCQEIEIAAQREIDGLNKEILELRSEISLLKSANVELWRNSPSTIEPLMGCVLPMTHEGPCKTVESYAPEMLEALKQATDQLEKDYEATPLDGTGALIRKLQAVIQKAEGA